MRVGDTVAKATLKLFGVEMTGAWLETEEQVIEFQAQDQELALVLEDGDVVEVLTATDALEAVMGELEDPLDRAYE